jgi:hypothetical protein
MGREEYRPTELLSTPHDTEKCSDGHGEQKLVAETIDYIDGYEFCCALVADTFFFP